MPQADDMRERLWTESDIAGLLEKAHKMGMDIEEPGFKEYRLSELERMVSSIQ